MNQPEGWALAQGGNLLNNGQAARGQQAAEVLLEGLNPPQAMAVQHTQGPLLVLAGAGTGKTNVLTRRIAYIMLTGSAEPRQILAVTFTNKAAREMADRTERLVGHSVAGMWLGTFHRLGVRFLRQHAELVRLRPDFVILDTDDQQRLVGQVLADVGLDKEQFPPRQVSYMLGKWKDHGYTPDSMPAEESAQLHNRAKQFYAAYQQRLTELNAADFGDLLLHPLHILQKHEAVRVQYQQQFKYILVDEYQDTNGVQYQWLKLLAQGHKNLCVVGDDDQSIYGWRGAQVGNILRFEQDFAGAEVVRLEQNYRSTGHILAAANGVIAQNRQRHGKNLWTEVANGGQVELHPHTDDREEARFVADAIGQHVRARGRFADTAILVRTAVQTRALEEALIRMGVPYVVVGGLKFYERKEVRDALAYLRLIANPADDLAFARIVNVPRRGVGETSLAVLEQGAKALALPQAVAIPQVIAQGDLSSRVAGALAQLHHQLGQWRMIAVGSTPDALAERVLEESGYLAMLRDDKSAGSEDSKVRLDHLKELLRALQDYPDLPSFLDHVALVTDGDADTDDTVKVMTIHAAKGLEFPLVFLPGFEEGLFPHQRAMNEEGQKGLEEERRLAYVAMTRARQRLVISFAHARRMWGQFLPGSPSRFVAEIPAENLKVVGGMTNFTRQGYAGGGFGQGQSGGGFGGGSNFGGGGYRAMPGSTADKRSTWKGVDAVKPAEPLVAYRNPVVAPVLDGDVGVGMRVFHQKFGNGRVLGMEGSGEARAYVVEFAKAGTKKLLASLAKLEVVG